MTKAMAVLTVALAFCVLGAFAEPATQTKSKDPVQKKEAPKETPKGKAKAMSLTFELYKDNADEFRFRLKDADGHNLAASTKGYATKAEARRVVEAIREHAGKARVDDSAK